MRQLPSVGIVLERVHKREDNVRSHAGSKSGRTHSGAAEGHALHMPVEAGRDLDHLLEFKSQIPLPLVSRSAVQRHLKDRTCVYGIRAATAILCMASSMSALRSRLSARASAFSRTIVSHTSAHEASLSSGIRRRANATSSGSPSPVAAARVSRAAASSKRSKKVSNRCSLAALERSSARA